MAGTDPALVSGVALYGRFECCVPRDSGSYTVDELARWRQSALRHDHATCFVRLTAMRDASVEDRRYATACTEAASHGAVNCLALAAERGYPWDEVTFEAAVRAGSVACMQLLYDGGCPRDERRVCEVAAGLASAAPLRLAMVLRFECDAATYVSAVLNGRMDCVRVAHRGHCPRSTTACATAALVGNLPCLRWLHEAGFPWDSTTCTSAVLGASAACLAWAAEHGAPLDPVACLRAAHLIGDPRAVCTTFVRNYMLRLHGSDHVFGEMVVGLNSPFEE